VNDDAARLLDSSKLILKRSAARLKRIREILRAKKLVLFSEEAVRARVELQAGSQAMQEREAAIGTGG